MLNALIGFGSFTGVLLATAAIGYYNADSLERYVTKRFPVKKGANPSK